jgi:hypothetical protein
MSELEIQLDRTECPRCGLTVLHDRDRPVSLWHVPAMLDSGQHIVPGYTNEWCEGFTPLPKPKLSLWIRFLRWCLS